MGPDLRERLDTTLRPFVTRALRGPRLRRTALAAALVAAFAGLFGLWLAWGEGELERETRVALELERPRWEIEQKHFTRLAFSDRTSAKLERSRDAFLRALDRGEPIHEDEFYGYAVDLLATDRLREGLGTPQHLLTPTQRELQRRASALLERHRQVFPTTREYAAGPPPSDDWIWREPERQEELARLVELQGVLAVERYHSPLGLAGGLRMVGMVSGGFLFLIVFLAAPAAAAAAAAQESHDRTIIPLSGTAMSAQALAVGLTAGSVTRPLLVGAALVPLLLLGALAPGGHLVAAAGLLLVLAAGGLLAIGLASLLGLISGAQRAPALVTAALFVPLAMGAFIGWAMGMGMERSWVGAMALLPQPAAAHLAREAFFPALQIPADYAPLADAGIAACTATAFILGILTLRAMARRIAAHATPLLRRGEALVGLGAVTVSAYMAIIPPARLVRETFELAPLHLEHTLTWMEPLAAFALVVGPALLLLMARVPRREPPLRLAPLPARSLATDAALLLLLPLAALVAAAAPAWPGAEALALAVPHILWALAVGALVAIHLVARPPRWWALGALSGMAVLACLEYTFGMVTMAELGNGSAVDLPFLMWGKLSPALGTVQLFYLLLAPVALLWRLRTRPPARRG